MDRHTHMHTHTHTTHTPHRHTSSFAQGSSAMELSPEERARRLNFVSYILGEKDQDGHRIVQRDPDPSKRDGDLYSRLFHMASYPREKYCDNLEMLRHLYVFRG